MMFGLVMLQKDPVDMTYKTPKQSLDILEDMVTIINKELEARAALRLATGLLGDNDHGGLSPNMSIMDKTSICLPYCNIPWFLRRFQQIGISLGVTKPQGIAVTFEFFAQRHQMSRTGTTCSVVCEDATGDTQNPSQICTPGSVYQGT